MTNQSPNTHTSKEDYSYLSPEVRKNWSKIPNDMKVVMLRSRTGNRNEGVNKNGKDGYATVKTSSLPPRKFTKDNLHELLAELISETSLFEQNEVDTPKYEPDSESELLVNYTSSNATNPGDIRKLMSAPGKSKAISNK